MPVARLCARGARAGATARSAGGRGRRARRGEGQARGGEGVEGRGGRTKSGVPGAALTRPNAQRRHPTPTATQRPKSKLPARQRRRHHGAASLLGGRSRSFVAAGPALAAPEHPTPTGPNAQRLAPRTAPNAQKRKCPNGNQLSAPGLQGLQHAVRKKSGPPDRYSPHQSTQRQTRPNAQGNQHTQRPKTNAFRYTSSPRGEFGGLQRGRLQSVGSTGRRLAALRLGRAHCTWRPETELPGSSRSLGCSAPHAAIGPLAGSGARVASCPGAGPASSNRPAVGSSASTLPAHVGSDPGAGLPCAPGNKRAARRQRSAGAGGRTPTGGRRL